jgi:tetratricopeptide (TPR) repeat protein
VPLWNTYFVWAGPLRNPRRAEDAARALVALAPDVPNTRHVLAWSLVMERRFDEAEAAMSEVLELDSSHAWALPNLAHLQLRRGAAAEAVATYRRIDSKASREHDALCLALALKAAGHGAEAESVARSAAEEMGTRASEKPAGDGDEALRATLLAVAGRTAEARAVLARAEAVGDPAVRDGLWFARAHVALGETDRAAALAQWAIAAGAADPYFVLIDPSLAPIRDRPEIDRLLPAGAPSP